jgi:hypothetical protein
MEEQGQNQYMGGSVLFSELESHNVSINGEIENFIS